MKSVRRSKAVATILAAAAIGAALLVRPITATADGPLDSAIPTSQPAPTPRQQRDIQEIIADFTACNRELTTVLPAKIISDPAKRNQAAPQAIPVLFHRLQLIDELAASKKVQPAALSNFKQESLALLYLLNEDATVTKVKGMLDSKDAARTIEGNSIQLSARWIGAGDDKLEIQKVVDEIGKLDRAHPDSSKLTSLTLNLAQSAETPEAKDQLESIIVDVMTDPMAKQLKPELVAQKAADAKLNSLQGKPLEITGKTVDGKDFTTGDWKGKVVLVDFWAVWCGPCVASLPHVKETYAKYHDQGLEIIGVDNDPKAETVTKFTEEKQMPWPQLFAPSTDPKNRFSPNTLQFGIMGIPTMFLIDKKGVCRSVTARAEMDELIPKLLAE